MIGRRLRCATPSGQAKTTHRSARQQTIVIMGGDATTVTTKALASEYIDQLKIRKNEISDEQWDVLRLEGYDVDGADPFSLPKTKTEFRAMLEAIAVEREQACGRLSTHMCPNTRL